MLGPARAAAEILAKKELETAILHIPTVKPFDAPAVLENVRQVPVAVSVEEHSRIGGLGSQVAELISEANLPTAPKFKRIGTPDIFPDRYGSQAGLLQRYGLTADAIAETVTGLANS
jgi:transketolase